MADSSTSTGSSPELEGDGVLGTHKVGQEELARFFETVLPHLNERQRRVVSGACSRMLGRGGKSAVASASGMSRNTVIKAEREVDDLLR